MQGRARTTGGRGPSMGAPSGLGRPGRRREGGRPSAGHGGLPAAGPGVPEILITPDMVGVVLKAEEALVRWPDQATARRLPELYQRAGVLVTVHREDPDGRPLLIRRPVGQPTIEAMSPAILQLVLAD